MSQPATCSVALRFTVWARVRVRIGARVRVRVRVGVRVDEGEGPQLEPASYLQR